LKPLTTLEDQLEIVVLSATGSVLVFWLALGLVRDTYRDPFLGVAAKVILFSASCIFIFCLGAIRYMAQDGLSLDEYYQTHGGWLVVFFISVVGLMAAGSIMDGLKYGSFI